MRIALVELLLMYAMVRIVKGQKIRPDSLPVMNDRRRDFCSRFDGYGDFCARNIFFYFYCTI